MSESYFFALIPRYLKADHGFAKTIKPNTKYRLVVYKGIQKCDEMKEPVRSKLVGGKIDLLSPELFFSIQFYSPTKNIQFTLKLYEEKPNEPQTQIASFPILSAEYIRSYKNSEGSSYFVEGKLIDDLAIGFDLVIEKSKFALTDAIKNLDQQQSHQNKMSKDLAEQNKSQSSRSRQAVREGDGFLSPRKRLERKSGHKSRLISRKSSKSDGEHSPEGSVNSSRRKWKKSPPSKQGQHFLHSPKKASPPKVSEAVKGKSVPKSDSSSKNIGSNKQISLNQEVNQKSYNNQKNTSSVNSPPVSPRNNVVDKPSVAKSNIISTQPKTPAIQSSVSQSAVRTSSQVNISPPVSPKQQVSQSSVPQPVSPRNVVQNPPTQNVNSKRTFADLQVKHTPQVFDIVQRNTKTQSSQSGGYQYQPSKSIKGIKSPKEGQQEEVGKVEEKKQVGLQKSTQKTKSKVQQTKYTQNTDKSSSGNARVESIPIRDDRSQEGQKSIQVRQKPVKKDKQSIHETGTLKGSVRLNEAVSRKKQDEEAKAADKAAQERRNQILYVAFLLVSLFLIYQAMQPTRRT